MEMRRVSADATGRHCRAAEEPQPPSSGSRCPPSQQQTTINPYGGTETCSLLSGGDGTSMDTWVIGNRKQSMWPDVAISSDICYPSWVRREEIVIYSRLPPNSYMDHRRGASCWGGGGGGVSSQTCKPDLVDVATDVGDAPSLNRSIDTFYRCEQASIGYNHLKTLDATCHIYRTDQYCCTPRPWSIFYAISLGFWGSPVLMMWHAIKSNLTLVYSW